MKGNSYLLSCCEARADLHRAFVGSSLTSFTGWHGLVGARFGQWQRARVRDKDTDSSVISSALVDGPAPDILPATQIISCHSTRGDAENTDDILLCWLSGPTLHIWKSFKACSHSDQHDRKYALTHFPKNLTLSSPEVPNIF